MTSENGTCNFCGGEAYFGEPPEGQICRGCDEWMCNDCMDWGKSDDSGCICNDCAEKEEKIAELEKLRIAFNGIFMQYSNIIPEIGDTDASLPLPARIIQAIDMTLADLKAQ